MRYDHAMNIAIDHPSPRLFARRHPVHAKPPFLPAIRRRFVIFLASLMTATSSFAQFNWPTEASVTDLTALRRPPVPGPLATGSVHTRLKPGDIAHIVLLDANSTATPDIWANAVRQAIASAGDFVTPAKGEPASYWLTAIVATRDGAYFMLQLDNHLAHLAGRSFHGYFPYR